MDLVVVRHSISVANHEDLISGAADVPLSDAGIAYAEQVRDAYDWARFDAVYASPLQRAHQTARILTRDRSDIQLDERLVEMNFGEWEGQTVEPILAAHPDAFDYTGMFNENYSRYAAGAESYAALIARVAAFLADLEAAQPDKNVLVVAHGMTIRALMAAALHAPVFGFGSVHNATLSRLHFDEHDGFRPRLEVFDHQLV
ncbi:histidine phosphatase family protein [Lacticaseibacillus absianus]|uniref:histidine phosphatase family protein n=1 Tax=Lacticaseibacillus absianus TaxID=2729623 RepID=UPI0015C7F463|nr:histidine phosphatase family protein [Lacticaseibacillus absianus]